jgi:hypothetical protein
MTVESATYPTQLDATLPLDADLVKEGAAHLRLLKQALTNAFPTVSGPLTALLIELNKVGFTQAQTSNDQSVASTAFVANAILNAVLTPATIPAQVGNIRKFLRTDGTSASWAYAGYGERDARTANTSLSKNDVNKFIDITSGTFSQTFDAAATLGNGWSVMIRNSGTGDITLDPNGAETIDGLTSFIMYPNEVRLVMCTGVLFVSCPLVAFARPYTSSGSFIMPPGYGGVVDVHQVGGGSGGGSGRRGAGGSAAGGGGGGAGGLQVSRRLSGIASGTNVTVTVGAAGTGGASITVDSTNGNPGVAGGDTSFGSYFTAYGGSAPSGGTAAGGAGGAGAGYAAAGTAAAAGVGGVGGAPAASGTSFGGGSGGNTALVGGASLFGAGGGAGGSSGTTAPAAGGNSQYSAGGGGGGGGISAADTGAAGSAGGATGNYAATSGSGGAAGAAGSASSNGAAGTAGTAGTVLQPGSSGGGGGSGLGSGGTFGVGGVGGAGGVPGGAGGGGGASRNTFASGAGGAGARGEVLVLGVL